MKITELQAGAIQIDDLDITNMSDEQYSKIKDLLFEKLIVVLKTNTTKAIYFNRICSKIGEIENAIEYRWYDDGSWYPKEVQPHFITPRDPFKEDEKKPYPVQRVTGQKDKDGNWTGIFQKGKLDWHCNLNNIHYADGVGLHGIRDVEGTVTSWMNTKLALDEMPESLFEKIKGKIALYRYHPEAWGLESDIAAMSYKNHARMSYALSLEQENNAGVKGIYIHPFNDMYIQGDSDGSLYRELYDYLFQEKFIYHHEWEVGDIVLSDQLLTQHKRQDTSDEVLEKRLLHRVTFNLSNQTRGIWVRNSKYQKFAKGYMGYQ